MRTKSTSKPPSAVAEHRRRLRSRGLQRVEVQVRGEDAPLLRAVAAALTDPDQASEAQTAPPEVPLSAASSIRSKWRGSINSISTPAAKAAWLPPP